MYKIMIVEDDVTITEVLERQLKKWGYLVQAVANFGSVLEQFETYEPHLVLLDISLPFFNGYHWCAEIRKISQTPIIFISSASDDMNLVMAINLGADDFVAKPFNLEVVTAKIQAVLRRTYSFGADMNVLNHNGVTLNLGESILLYGNERLELTKNEFRIMQLLMEHKGNTVARDTIIKKLWETESFIDDNTLTVNVTRLRKKLEGIGLSDFIATKKGVGYLVEA
ncbi:response regulator transcription factor [Hydrogenoanaerobacterium sp.]|uniref:response regulator transcription factor n=1 Tax=Hydrogenoanaerobacterium sp. TaxID=2953763 RepID=UPI002896838E|nr:response regulator transcription factor [Hydrogenoanaerobacterium sp.]